jgi:hypothetical protein
MMAGRFVSGGEEIERNELWGIFKFVRGMTKLERRRVEVNDRGLV